MINPNCQDARKCDSVDGEVRVLEVPHEKRAVCRGCYEARMDYRRKSDTAMPIPSWESLPLSRHPRSVTWLGWGAVDAKKQMFAGVKLFPKKPELHKTGMYTVETVGDGYCGDLQIEEVLALIPLGQCCQLRITVEAID